MKLYGALEAGGTKMVCAVGHEDGTILERISIPTSSPDETISAITDYFCEKEICALGIGCFGPIDLHLGSETWGYILDTPKFLWKHFDIVGAIHDKLPVPIGFDTDVNASLLGEITYGSAKGLTDVIYITIGTGIGAGIMSGGNLIHGMLHPEAGHMKVTPHPDDDYAGKCPYHGTCFEGMASGPAIEARWGRSAKELTDEPKVWELEAYYIAQALTSLIMTLSPQRIILGGGVMHQTQLYKLIRAEVIKDIAGYLNTPELADIDNYIVPASLGDDQGIMGALKLAADAVK